MAFSWFISKRLISSDRKQNQFSRPIIRLSVAAIAFSVAVIIISLATGIGLQKEIKSKLTTYSGDVQIRSYQSSLGWENKPITLDQSWVDVVENLEAVERVQQVSTRAGILKSSAFYEGAIFKGGDGNYRSQSLKNALVWGKIPDFSLEGPSDSILISKHLYNLLAIEEGERLAMYFFRPAPQAPLLRYFYISGVYETGLEQIDESIIVGDIRHLTRINGWEENQVGSLEIFLHPKFDMEDVAQQIRNLVPHDVDAVSARSLYEQLFQWVELFDINIIIIFVVMLLVSAINISSALMIMLLERTPMIGLLKSMGARNKQIRDIFLQKSIYLIVKGLFWGNLFGAGLAFLQKNFKIITLDQSVYYVSHVPIYLNLWHLFLVNIITVLFCWVCLLVPAMFIGKIQPAKTIRFS